MKRILKIMIVCVIASIVFINNCYAKYTYNFEEIVIKLRRDTKAPNCEVEYSTKEITKENVIITIKCDKEIEQVSGFVLSDDKKTLTKEVSENESATIIVNDMCGNKTEVNYEVNNIDKENPQIIGCENGGIYNGPIELDYIDNVEIKNVVVQKYAYELELEYKDKFYACNDIYGIDRTSSTLTIHVKNHPLNTKQYSYYLNNVLYTTTTEDSFTYTGLNRGTEYTMKVQALDANGNILDEKEQLGKTGYFTKYKFNFDKDKFFITFFNMDDEVRKMVYNVWDESITMKLKSNINSFITDSSKVASLLITYFPNIEKYYMKAAVYNYSGEIIDYMEWIVQKDAVYKKIKNELPNKIVESGNYQIYVEDTAGNNVTYYIKVE